MKIRNRHLIRAAGRLGAGLARLLVRTLKVEYRPLGPDMATDRLALSDRFIFSVWHENLLLPVVRFGGPDLAVLLSSHRDAEVLVRLITSIGMDLVRGSTTRGGVEAVRNMLKPDVRWRNLAISPDGPRGPRRVVQSGMVYVASRTGMKIVPLGVGYDQPWRTKSWDRFAVPRPFTRARCLTGYPIAIPPGLRSAGLEEHRLRVQAEMDRLNALAERWAETDLLLVPPAALSHFEPVPCPVS
jgi:lysophospholipid acyltransferase (LPLAT)-like uncharacterized protein